MPLVPPSHFLLLSYLCETFKLPFRLQTLKLRVWQTWVSPSHDLTLKKKKIHYTARHVHTIRPLSLKEKHNFQQSRLPEAKGANIQNLT